MNRFIFAQSTDLPNVPAETLKWIIIVIIALVLIGCAVAGAIALLRKSPIKIDDQPAVEVRKAPKRYNHDLSEQRYNDHERRLVGLEEWRIDETKSTNRHRERVMFALGRIASKLNVDIEPTE